MRRRPYSRLARTEEKRNIKKAVYFILASLGFLVLLIFVGIPAIAKVTAFVADLKKSSAPIEKVDTTPPAPPRIESLPEFTDNKNLEIKGTAEAGSSVILSLNNKQQEVVANSDGQYIFQANLQLGVNNIFTTAKDTSGNESNSSETVEVIYDNIPPEISVDSPEYGSKFYTNKNSQVEIKGQTEENSTVTVNDRLAKVNDDGTFVLNYQLSEGENNLTIKATDQAGNTSESSITLFYYP